MKPFLSNKNKATEKITLVSDDKIFSDDLEIAEKFNEFFKNAVNNLNLSSNEDLLLSTKASIWSSSDSYRKIQKSPVDIDHSK